MMNEENFLPLVQVLFHSQQREMDTKLNFLLSHIRRADESLQPQVVSDSSSIC